MVVQSANAAKSTAHALLPCSLVSADAKRTIDFPRVDRVCWTSRLSVGDDVEQLLVQHHEDLALLKKTQRDSEVSYSYLVRAKPCQALQCLDLQRCAESKTDVGTWKHVLA
jgi:hypothetical protein